MIAEAIQKLADLGKGELKEIDGVQWYFHGRDFPVQCVPKPVAPIETGTLTSIADYVNLNPDGLDGLFVCVESYKNVNIVGPLDPKSNTRPLYMTATICQGEFDRNRVGQMRIDEFIITLQSRFVQTPERDNLLAFVSGIRCEDTTILDDDGTSQEVAVKRGVKSSRERTPNPVVLVPFRTFPEIVQPASSFVFRLGQNADGSPAARLFCSDGGAWESSAVLLIREWLSSRVKCPILA